MVFVDTGAWFASVVVDEPHHYDVNSWLENNSEPLSTTDYCLTETLNLFVARRRPSLGIAFGKALLKGKLASLHYLKEAQIARAFVLFESRCNAGWSFTDCTSKIVVDDLGINRAVALDQHFRQFGIEVVP